MEQQTWDYISTGITIGEGYGVQQTTNISLAFMQVVL